MNDEREHDQDEAGNDHLKTREEVIETRELQWIFMATLVLLLLGSAAWWLVTV